MRKWFRVVGPGGGIHDIAAVVILDGCEDELVDLPAELEVLPCYESKLSPWPIFKKERPKVELPPIITREWLVNLLARELNLDVETVTTDESWYSPTIQWVPDSEKEMVAYHGESARGELLAVFVALAKKALDNLKVKPLAVGMTEDENDGSGQVSRFRVWFRMPNAYAAKPINKDLYGSGSVTT